MDVYIATKGKLILFKSGGREFCGLLRNGNEYYASVNRGLSGREAYMEYVARDVDFADIISIEEFEN